MIFTLCLYILFASQLKYCCELFNNGSIKSQLNVPIFLVLFIRNFYFLWKIILPICDRTVVGYCIRKPEIRHFWNASVCSCMCCPIELWHFLFSEHIFENSANNIHKTKEAFWNKFHWVYWNLIKSETDALLLKHYRISLRTSYSIPIENSGS